jgi:hypothetical protein
MHTHCSKAWPSLALACCVAAGRLEAQNAIAAPPVPGTLVRVHLARRGSAPGLPGFEDGVGVATLLRADNGGLTVRLRGGWTYELPADAVARLEVRRGGRLCGGIQRAWCALGGVLGGAAAGLAVGGAIGAIHVRHARVGAVRVPELGDRDSPPAVLGAATGGLAGLVVGLLFDGQRWAPLRGWPMAH